MKRLIGGFILTSVLVQALVFTAVSSHHSDLAMEINPPVLSGKLVAMEINPPVPCGFNEAVS